jgi:hypothetical protein
LPKLGVGAAGLNELVVGDVDSQCVGAQDAALAEWDGL